MPDSSIGFVTLADSSRDAASPELVPVDSEPDHRTNDNLLIESIDIEQHGAITDERDEKCANQGPENSALASKKTCPTDNRGGDHIQL